MLSNERGYKAKLTVVAGAFTNVSANRAMPNKLYLVGPNTVKLATAEHSTRRSPNEQVNVRVVGR